MAFLLRAVVVAAVWLVGLLVVRLLTRGPGCVCCVLLQAAVIAAMKVYGESGATITGSFCRGWTYDASG